MGVLISGAAGCSNEDPLPTINSDTGTYVVTESGVVDSGTTMMETSTTDSGTASETSSDAADSGDDVSDRDAADAD